jgi:hypothetical protein
MQVSVFVISHIHHQFRESWCGVWSGVAVRCVGPIEI